MALFQDLNEELLVQNFVHVGTPSHVLNPPTRSYWAKHSGSFMTFDVLQVISQLESAKKKILGAISEKKDVLLIAQKDAVKADLISIAARFPNVHYLSHNVPAGFLTNFDTLIKRITVMNEKQKYIHSDNFLKITKKEQEQTKREYMKVQKVYEGVAKLTKKPDLVVVVDGMQLISVVKELKLTGVDNVVLASSDLSMRRPAANLVTMNVHSIKSIQFVLKYLFG